MKRFLLLLIFPLISHAQVKLSNLPVTTSVNGSDPIPLVHGGTTSIITFTNFKTALSLTSGTVTSINMTVPSGLSVSGGPITGAGSLAVTTSLSGILKGTGSGFTAATHGTDFFGPSDVITVPNGGTGVSSLTAYGIMLGGTTGTGAVQSLGTGSANQILLSGGAGALPIWSTLNAIDLPVLEAQSYQINGYMTLFTDPGNKLFSFVGNDTRAASFDLSSLSSNRAYILPDAAGTLLLVNGNGSSLTNITAGQIGVVPTGVLKGSGGAFVAATAGTDFLNTASSLSASKLAGTTTNDSASAGIVGEYVVTTVLPASAVALTTATQTNVANVSLTAGDWDVTFEADFKQGASIVPTYYIAGVSSTSVTLPTNFGQAKFSGAQTVAQDVELAGSTTRFSLAGTTTIYLVVKCGFTTDTMSAYGIIRARRVR